MTLPFPGTMLAPRLRRVGLLRSLGLAVILCVTTALFADVASAQDVEAKPALPVTATEEITATETVSPAATVEPEEEAQETGEATSIGEAAITSWGFMPYPFSPSGPLTVTLAGAEDAEALQRFVRHLLAGYSPLSGIVTATVGALPVTLPMEIPLPEQAGVLGSIVRSGEYEEVQIYLTAEGEVDELGDAVRRQLQAAGFAPPPAEDYYGAGQVFLSNVYPMPAVYCSPENDYYLTLTTMTLAGEPPALQISANLLPVSIGGPCSQIPYDQGAAPYLPLPQLTPPPETRVLPGGTSFGGDELSAEAKLESSLPLAEVAEHYTSQLEEAGWTRLEESAADIIAWSGWSFTDRQENRWVATFYLVREAGTEDKYLATLRAKPQR